MPTPDCATRLSEAREALHALTLGRAVVEVRHRDRTVRYDEAKRVDLEKYLRQLEAECGGPNGTGDCAKRRRAFRVTL